MKNISACCLLLAALWLPTVVLADDPQLYRWTDAQGVIHYSDQPPTQPATDLATSAMPVFPAVDQAKLDQEQAALLAQAAALQQLVQAQAAAQAAARLAAAELAAQEAPPVVPATDDSYSPAPIYVNSAFVPRIYRANLYIPHHHGGSRSSPGLPSRPAISVLRPPH